MSFSPLSTKDAATKLKVDLIENGIGTQALHETVVAYQRQSPRRHALHQDQGDRRRFRQEAVAPKGHRQRPFRLQVLARLVRRRRGLRPASPRLFQEDEQGREAARAAQGDQLARQRRRGLPDRCRSRWTAQDQGPRGQAQGRRTRRRPARSLVIEAPTRIFISPRGIIPHLETVTGDLVNAEQLLRYDKIFITDGALGKLSARLQK